MRKYEIKNKDDIKLHNILFAYTSPQDYEMERLLLLEDMPNTKYGEYVLIEGFHCSCYDFDECDWNATVYNMEELKKLLDNISPYEETRIELKKWLYLY